MGISIEYNWIIALRSHHELVGGNVSIEECLPVELKLSETYHFQKLGQRNYPLLTPTPLVETLGNGNFTRVVALVELTQITHYLKDKIPWTKGNYRVLEMVEREIILLN